MKRKISLVLVVVLMMFLPFTVKGESSESDPIPVEKITISKESVVMYTGNNSAYLSVTVSPINATNQGIVWESSDETVASIAYSYGNNASVRPVGEGKAVVYARTTDGSNLEVSCKVVVKETLAYAVLCDNKDLVFFRSYDVYENDSIGTFSDSKDNQYTGRLFTGFEEGRLTFGISRTWIYYASASIETVRVADGYEIVPVKTSSWFSGCKNLSQIDFDGFDFAYSLDMSLMFYQCSSLNQIDLSCFNTGMTKDMNCMFENCSSLTELDLGSFDTSNVTNMCGMFINCTGLTELDLSDFDTSNVTTMASMFRGCTGLTELDLSDFDTSSLANMGAMFEGCTGLAELDLSNFETGKVTNMARLFKDCIGLMKLNLSSLDTSNVTDMSEMFSGCRGLSELDLDNFDTGNVMNMSKMFYRCGQTSGLQINVRSFNTENVTDMSSMFFNCLATELDLNNFSTSKVTNMSGMFDDCWRIHELDLSSFDTRNVQRMDYMFYYCGGLRTLDISSFDTSATTTMNRMFTGSDNIETIKLGQRFVKWDSNAQLPEARWKNAAKGLIRSSAQLQTDYPSHADFWSGAWEKTDCILSVELNAMNTDGISLSWDDIGATKYQIYRDDSLLKTVTGTTYINNVGRTMGEEYTYKVRGLVDESWTDFSDELTVMYNPFCDVPADSASFTYVAWAYNHKIVNGLSNDHTRFGLMNKCTRTQFCYMLWNMVGKPDVTGMACPFVDISSLSANNQNSIVWCYNEKIVNGTTATTFNPNGDITRANLAIMIWKLAGQPKIGKMTCPYTDISGLSSNNQRAIIWCYNRGLIDSITGTQFGPKEKGNRALLVEMLYGYYQTVD